MLKITNGSIHSTGLLLQVGVFGRPGRLRTDDGQPGSHQLAGRISTDKRPWIDWLANFQIVGNPDVILGPTCPEECLPMPG
jgi:hypothetical protein